MHRILENAGKTVGELYRDRKFWAGLGLAVVPWAANTMYQMSGGEPLPYAEISMDILRGPVGAYVATKCMKNYLERELNAGEALAYSLLGGAVSGGIWGLREAATNAIPLLEPLTPDPEIVSMARDIAETGLGGLISGLAGIANIRKRKKS